MIKKRNQFEFEEKLWDDEETPKAQGAASLGNPSKQSQYNNTNIGGGGHTFTEAPSPLSTLAKQKADADAAVKGYKPFQYGNQAQLDTIIQRILNREKFSYDLNADALYNQYKDKFTQQGKMAMMDTMGQAQAMTGGYGNSYAQSVGQQAYQGQLQNLNDIVPDLYQMALDKYNADGQQMLEKYGMLVDDYNREYGEYADDYKKLLADREYADSAYNDYIDAVNKKSTTEDTIRAEVLKSLGYTDEQIASGELESESAVSDEIVAKISEIGDNQSLAKYLDGLEANKVISPKEANKLFAKYVDKNEKYYTDENDNITGTSYKDMVSSTNGWTVVDDGGNNLLGIDKNAIVASPTEEKMTLKQLRQKLIAEGMTRSEANKAIKALQQSLGISDNVIFGW